MFHAAWTDNRDVRPPLDGNWAELHAADRSPGGSPTSLFDPTKTVPVCQAGNAGSRNQNVYTARIAGGLLVGAPGNTKPLSPTLQRGFVGVRAEPDDRDQDLPDDGAGAAGGRPRVVRPVPAAAVRRVLCAPLTFVDVRVPPRSTAARTVYVTSTDPHAQAHGRRHRNHRRRRQRDSRRPRRARACSTPTSRTPTSRIPTSRIPTSTTPISRTPRSTTPDIENPDIENPDIDNPDIENPDIENPDIENVVVANPDIENLTIANPDIENPDIENPDIENPDIDNPDIDNGALADVTWKVSNTGNTTAAFNVNLFLAQRAAGGHQDAADHLQDLQDAGARSRTAATCASRHATCCCSNMPNPTFITAGEGVPDQNDPSDTNATLWLSPGEEGRVTLRVFDNDPSNNITCHQRRRHRRRRSILRSIRRHGLTLGIAAQGVGTRSPSGRRPSRPW